MLPKYTIGLNETQLGIVAPSWFMATMTNTIPLRKAELALTLGTLFNTDEALKIGLIDEIAQTKAEAITKCEAFLDRYKKIPPMARAITKQSCRGPAIVELENNRDADIELFIGAITNEGVQKSLGYYVNLLKWKKRMKPFTDFSKFVRGLLKPQRKK